MYPSMKPDDGDAGSGGGRSIRCMQVILMKFENYNIGVIAD